MGEVSYLKLKLSDMEGKQGYGAEKQHKAEVGRNQNQFGKSCFGSGRSGNGNPKQLKTCTAHDLCKECLDRLKSSFGPWKNWTRKGEKSGCGSDDLSSLWSAAETGGEPSDKPCSVSLSACSGKIRSDGFKIFI